MLSAVEIEETSRQQRGGSGFASPAHMRNSTEMLSPIVGGPITAKLGGGGIKRSSLTSLGGGNALGGGGGGMRGGSASGSKVRGALLGVGAAARPNPDQAYSVHVRLARTVSLLLSVSFPVRNCEPPLFPHVARLQGLDMPSNQMVLLDRLAAAEARITQLEQQQSFTREMMQAATAGGAAFGAAGASARPAADTGGIQAASAPQVMALEAKIVALEVEVSGVAR